MSTNKHPAGTVSRQTLDSTPIRTLAFLRAVGTDPTIHSALAAVGFTDKDVERGWALLRAVFDRPKRFTPSVSNPVATAMEELEAWNRPGFLRARAALRHLHPEHESFVFDGLDVGQGAQAVLFVATFLARCAQLESGKGRRATRKADRAALQTLETRGVTKSERKRLGALVSIVETQAAPLPDVETAPVADRVAEMMQLRAWLLDWTDTARAVIKRRDQLIRLGIGKRRSKKHAPPPRIATTALLDDDPAPDSAGPSGPLRRAA